MDTITVHGAPSEYILQEGILEQLEVKLLARKLQKVLIVHGQKSWKAAKLFFPKFTEVSSEEYTYSGECSLEEIAVIAKMVHDQSFDAIIGVGGGKVLDLVKSVGEATNRSSILIPTLASNCSPWTPVSVIYDEFGRFSRFDIYPVGASLVLVEPRILLAAPLNMLIAGIGDTLAKWYEANVQMESLENKPVPLQISFYTARQCKDLLLKHSEGAISAVKAGRLNDDFIKVVETIIVLGGMVGGFGDRYGRIAGAHSIHNGLTVIKETHHALHGEKVAYGILVQLVLEEKLDEIQQLLPFYRKLKLPVSLTDLGVAKIDKNVIARIAEKSTVQEESIHVMPLGPITPNRVMEAITILEESISY
ncbi:iron-containing alcohol dehydrogenase family protein [Bacillus sp. Bva_UNVM-123]|uniref:iron-containing alcohol dehydrogenase family protein n=1 Tax=Bacillus sp. Bva_UNVM-123 TaxID=2829798 RepID=UPI00391FA41A